MSKSGDINAQNLNRVTLCTRCGYALQGLPSRGRCPECGRAYSPDVLVLFGNGQGGEKTFGAPDVATTLLYFLIIGYIVYAEFVPLQHRRYFQWVPIAAILMSQIWRRYRPRSGMPAETQVHLSPSGFGLRDGPGDVTMAPWQTKHRVLIRALPRDLYRLQIKFPLMQYVTNHPLDFTFEADEATALRVAERIEQYRNGRKVERDFALNEPVQR
jgi:hypothetical protein